MSDTPEKKEATPAPEEKVPAEKPAPGNTEKPSAAPRGQRRGGPGRAGGGPGGRGRGRRPQPPQDQKIVGQKNRKRRPRGLSDYGKMLREKQDLKKMYNLRERQFRKYVKEVLQKQSGSVDLTDLLIKRLESRLDNTIFRLGFATTRQQARQLVSHGHFLVNGRKVTVPSVQVLKGDVVTAREASVNKNAFKTTTRELAKYQPPVWLKLDAKAMSGTVTGEPSIGEVQPPVRIPLIFEFYSR